MATIQAMVIAAVAMLAAAEARAADVPLVPQTQRDDFSGYSEGGEPTPAWRTTSPFWEVHGGSLISEDAGREFAVFQKCPPGSELSIEADVTVTKPSGKDWKVAGVAVYADKRNYWHLALVEAPDDKGRLPSNGHFVELSEMLDGNWLAQSLPGSKLAADDHEGLNLKWQVGQRYRLTLALAADTISGRVADADGKLLARLSFRRGAKDRSVAWGWPALVNANLITRFGNVAASVSKSVPIPAGPDQRQFPKPNIAGFAEVKGKATGFFHVEQIEGRHWIITPAGQGYLMIGTDHVNFNAHFCEKLGIAPYHQNVQKLFGQEDAWAADSSKRLTSWGFNALGAGHSDSVRYRGLAHTGFLSFGSGFAAYSDIVPSIHWTSLPNVFSPKFRRFCEHRAAEYCTPGDPWLIGYFIDNELEWYGKSGTEEGVCEEAWKKPPAHEAKVELVELFKKRHADIASFNRAWGTAFKDWTDLLESTTPPAARDEQARADAAAFLKLVGETYFATAEAAIRKADPNHMILGCRFAGRGADVLWESAGKHCDIVTVNIYPRVNMEKRVAPGVEEELKKWYALAGRPLAITEWSFPASVRVPQWRPAERRQA